MGWRGPYLGKRMPRRFLSHKGTMGAAFRTHYASLEQTYGPFTSELIRQAAADAAQAHVVKLTAVRTWEQAQAARTNGKGRRPNTRLLIQLSKRIALESMSYQSAINRLEAVAGKPRPVDLAQRLAAQYGGAPA